MVNSKKQKKHSEKFIVPLAIQWHITTNCSNRCKHCYMYDESTFENERNNTLSFSDLIKIMDSLEDFEQKYNAKFVHFSITGGDPLMRKDCFEFLAELKRRGKKVSLMGNPETLNEDTIVRLSKMGVFNFQMSLDGLEKTHDFFRAPGSFKRTVEKLKLLRKYDIATNIMFTLYPTNSDELIPLLRFVATSTQATSFSFDIGCLAGNGRSIEEQFNAQQIQKIFSEYYKEKKRLKAEGYSIVIHEKSNFHKLTRFENKLLYPIIPESSSTLSGCLIGWTPPSILSDGTALVCRRLPIKAGKMPEQSFEDIFLGNNILKKFRRPQFFKTCGSCDFYSICRGCPANVYGLTKDPFGKHHMCFRESISKKTSEKNYIRLGPSLKTTYKEEWEYISSRYKLNFKMRDYVKEKDFRDLYFDLSQDSEELTKFFDNPHNYIFKNKKKLSRDQIAQLMYYFSEKNKDEKKTELNEFNDPLAAQAFSFILKDLI